MQVTLLDAAKFCELPTVVETFWHNFSTSSENSQEYSVAFLEMIWEYEP
jgi:hypothetical protein